MAAGSGGGLRALIREVVTRSPGVGLVSEMLFLNAGSAARHQFSTSLAHVKCPSQKKMLSLALIHPTAPGLFALSPLLTRSLEKLTRLAELHMRRLGASKIQLPSLAPADQWEKSGRLEQMGSELLQLSDRSGGRLVLSPTFEESITSLVAAYAPKTSQMPVKLFQTGPKFRDEPRPKSGLLRCREFMMKDLYSFHQSEDDCREFYTRVQEEYRAFFAAIGLDGVEEVEAPSGQMGGHLSHEYLLRSASGEDTLLRCDKPGCGKVFNGELEDKLPPCGLRESSPVSMVELGHTFMLGTRYSALFDCTLDKKQGGAAGLLLHMGCYGLGLSRILAAIVDHSLSGNGGELTWPESVAPYRVCVIPPKAGSKEEDAALRILPAIAELAERTADPYTLSSDLLIDDRVELTIGKRLKEATAFGYPHVLVLGRDLLEDCPCVQLISNQETTSVPVQNFVSTVLKLLQYPSKQS